MKIWFLFFLTSLCCCQSNSSTNIHSSLTKSSLPKDGPTLQLPTNGNQTVYPADQFLYFIRLVSPEPVKVTPSPQNTQMVHFKEIHQVSDDYSFCTTVQMELTGTGSLHNLFDHTKIVTNHQKVLLNGQNIEKILDSITVSGNGFFNIEISGTQDLEKAQQIISNVKIIFNPDGQPSPVSAIIFDYTLDQGNLIKTNQMKAIINTLSFDNLSMHSPTMKITVNSINGIEETKSIFSNLIAEAKGIAVNLLLEPVIIDPIGNQTMLEFGKALTLQQDHFTFPKDQKVYKTQ